MKKLLTTRNFRLYPTKEQKCLLDREFKFYRHYFNALKLAIAKKRDESLLPLVEQDILDVLKSTKEKILSLDFDFKKYYYRCHIKFASDNMMNAFKYPRKKGLKRYRLNKTTIKIDDPSCYVMLNHLYFKNTEKIKIRPKVETLSGVSFYTITKNRDKYYLTAVSFVEEIKARKTGKGCGIDVGFRNGLVLYNTDGAVEEYKFQNVKVDRLFKQVEFYKKTIEHLEEKNKDYLKSKNYQKVINKLARTYERITNIRNHEFNLVSEALALKYDLIVVEDLEIEDIYKGNVKRYEISKASFGRFFDYVKNKCQKYGKYFIKTPRLFPSSQICSECGVIHREMKDYRDMKMMVCECGYKEDRDINAAKNILRYGLEEIRRRNQNSKNKFKKSKNMEV